MSQTAGTLEALGTDARLHASWHGHRYDAARVPDHQAYRRRRSVRSSGAQVDLSSATISGGTLSVGGGSFAETVAGSGTSTLSNLAVTGSGTLEANTLSTL